MLWLYPLVLIYYYVKLHNLCVRLTNTFYSPKIEITQGGKDDYQKKKNIAIPKRNYQLSRVLLISAAVNSKIFGASGPSFISLYPKI